MLYTVLTSIGNSFTQQVSTVLEEEGVDIAVQAKYASSPVSSIINNDTAEAITHFAGVSSSAKLLIGRKRINNKASVFILGASNFNVFSQRLGLNIIKGRTFSSEGRDIIVGEKMAKIFGLNIGSKLELNNGKKYLIVGIYSSWFNFLNSGMVIDLERAQKLINKPGKVSLIFLALDDTTKTATTVRKINKQFPDMRAVESQQLPASLSQMKSIFYFSKIVSVVTLLIALAVLLNTFIMAMSERTKEVGILSAIGWSRQMIILIFLVESLLLSFGGGIIGYLCSYPVMSILLSNFTNMNMYLPEAPSINIFFNVLMMSLFIGILSALFPALYGTNINIAKAIHHE